MCVTADERDDPSPIIYPSKFLHDAIFTHKFPGGAGISNGPSVSTSEVSNGRPAKLGLLIAALSRAGVGVDLLLTSTLATRS